MTPGLLASPQPPPCPICSVTFWVFSKEGGQARFQGRLGCEKTDCRLGPWPCKVWGSPAAPESSTQCAGKPHRLSKRRGVGRSPGCQLMDLLSLGAHRAVPGTQFPRSLTHSHSHTLTHRHTPSTVASSQEGTELWPGIIPLTDEGSLGRASEDKVLPCGSCLRRPPVN